MVPLKNFIISTIQLTTTNPITMSILIIITKQTIEKISVHYLKPKTITLGKQ